MNFPYFSMFNHAFSNMFHLFPCSVIKFSRFLFPNPISSSIFFGSHPVVLGCPMKLGSMVSKWLSTPIYHIYKWNTHWSQPLIRSLPSRDIQGRLGPQPWAASTVPAKSVGIWWPEGAVLGTFSTEVFLVGGWTNPSEKYESNWTSSPIFGVKI